MLLAAVLAAGLATIYGVQHVLTRETGSVTVTPLTTFPGEELQPSLSRDGNQVAFAFNGGRSSKYDIYVKTIGSEEITRLTSDPNDDLSPSWSPDGQNIVFLRFVSDQEALVMIVPSSGGAERQLAKLQIERIKTEIRVAWSPDGEWVATSEKETPLSPMRLVLISSRTGRKWRLPYRPPAMASESDVSPSFSPNGRYLAYARNISIAVGDIYVLKLPKEDGPATDARPLTRWNRLNRTPVWSGMVKRFSLSETSFDSVGESGEFPRLREATRAVSARSGKAARLSR
jgi:Tol biopolymer transport system component